MYSLYISLHHVINRYAMNVINMLGNTDKKNRQKKLTKKIEKNKEKQKTNTKNMHNPGLLVLLSLATLSY